MPHLIGWVTEFFCELRDSGFSKKRNLPGYRSRFPVGLRRMYLFRGMENSQENTRWMIISNINTMVTKTSRITPVVAQ